LNQFSQAVQPVASHYTKCAILVPKIKKRFLKTGITNILDRSEDNMSQVEDENVEAEGDR
jgi:hypothetical protein